MIEMPEDFLKKMRLLLKDEFADFLKSYQENRSQGLRINTLKVSVEEFLKKNPFHLEQIPWIREGFYYDEEDRPGKHPYHEAGLYYIQEPSAMAAGIFLDPQPEEKVLDLCAAPGGKTTHLAMLMEGKGLLVANEIYPARAKVLSQNVERMGVRNAVVTSESSGRLAGRFPAFFDRILVDAPCSGEGMFRKDPDARNEWSLENVAVCAARQNMILQDAAVMLKPGGRLVYSTCTFSPEENEGVISEFLQKEPHFEIEDVYMHEGFGRGREEWAGTPADGIGKTIRIWPHEVRGEGHYIAVLRKKDGEEPRKGKPVKALKDQKLLKDYFQFAKENLTTTPHGTFIVFGEQLYIIPEEMVSFEKLKVLRPGWHLGTLKKNRFEPSHALALSLRKGDALHTVNLDSNSPEIIAYLKGETIETSGKKGWHLVEVDGYSLGWGKLSGQILKNHFPKGLRWTGI